MSKQLPRFSQQVEGAILGFAVGDALGVPAEFMSRSQLRRSPILHMQGGGAHRQPAGTWSDDTSMTLCTMDSLTACGIDYTDLMRRFSDWRWNSCNTARGEVFDIGITTQNALLRFLGDTPALDCGDTDENTCGNGSLMRILPTALYLTGRFGCRDLDDWAAEVIHNTSKCTHAHPRCQMACGIYSSVVFHLCSGGSLPGAVEQGVDAALRYYGTKAGFSTVAPDFNFLPLLSRWYEGQIGSSGYVLHTLQAALWCLLTTSSYAECVRKAVNLGEDTDTTAAVAGGLAGLWYGPDAIPADWARTTAQYDALRTRCRSFSRACLGASRPS